MATVAQITPFEQVLRYAAVQASASYPSLQDCGRILKAVELVLNGHVELHLNGTATVQSQANAHHTYDVNGACQCPDYATMEGGRCKHRYAKALLKATTRHLAQAYYATHYSAGQEANGLAFPTDEGHEWVFLPEDSLDVRHSDQADLVLGGFYPLVQHQRKSEGNLVAAVCNHNGTMARGR